jgi:tetratricopeptide (TPR) repeat protein
MRLNRLLVRIPDKAAVNKLVIEATEPYLQLPEAHFARAQSAYNAKDMAKAGTEIDAVLSAQPDWELAILFKAMLVESKPEDVVVVLQPFVNKYPQAADARLGLARALVGAHRFDDALVQFKILQSQQPDNPDVIYAVGLLSTQNGDYATAESQFKRLIDMNYPQSNLVRVYLGQIAEDKKDDQAAATWYAGVTSGPQYLDAQARAAQLTARAGNVDGAIAMLHKVQATTDDDRVQLVLTEATILREAQRYDAAYAMLDKALATRPNDPDLLYEAALDADYLKKFDLSERLWQKLIAMKPDSAQAYNAWGYSLADRGVRLDEAQSLIDKALEMRPDDPFILDSKGWVLFRKGEKQAALDLLQRAYKGRPDPEIAAHIGEVLWSLGRQDDARNVLTDAARNYPGNAALSDTIKRFMTP